jgi:hypothetical protein
VDESYNNEPLVEYCYTDPFTKERSDEVIDICDPFLISVEEAVPFLSFQTTMNIGSGMHINEANENVSRINFSAENYSFSIQNTSLVYPEYNHSEINLLILLFVIIISIVMFTFT